MGFQEVDIPRAGAPALHAAFWYPSQASAGLTHLAATDQWLAVDAAVAGRDLPLVAISPGTLGKWSEHADTAWALAKAGFVVVSATADDVGAAFKLKPADRSRQLSDMIDYALGRWQSRALAHSVEIGAFGFSLGGFGVLVDAGGRPEVGRIAPHCRAAPAEWSCVMTAEHRLGLEGPAAPTLDWHHDARLKAMVVAAPALGYLFGANGLAAVDIPVQLWQAADDDVLAEPWNAQAVARDLPHSPEFHLVAGAAHADFTAPCSRLNTAGHPALCKDRSGFSRARFHRVFNAAVVGFFRRWLGGGALP